MPRVLVPGQFMVLSGSHQISGKEVLEMFRFDQKLCKIEARDDGSLHITQEGKHSFTAVLGFWEEVEIVTEENLGPDQLLFRTESGFMAGPDFLELWGFLPSGSKIETLANGVLLVSQEDPWKIYSAEPGDWVKATT